MSNQLIIDDLDKLKERLGNERYVEKVLLFSELDILCNWESIKADPYNNRPDIETPEEYIKEAKANRVTAGGYRVIITEPIE